MGHKGRWAIRLGEVSYKGRCVVNNCCGIANIWLANPMGIGMQ